MEQVTGRRLDAMLYKRMAARKLAVFRQYAQLYPEYCWVFVGDNGQACPCSPAQAAAGSCSLCWSALSSV